MIMTTFYYYYFELMFERIIWVCHHVNFIMQNAVQCIPTIIHIRLHKTFIIFFLHLTLYSLNFHIHSILPARCIQLLNDRMEISNCMDDFKGRQQKAE